MPWCWSFLISTTSWLILIISRFLISPFPHFLFPISHFLVPGFITTLLPVATSPIYLQLHGPRTQVSDYYAVVKYRIYFIFAVQHLLSKAQSEAEKACTCSTCTSISICSTWWIIFFRYLLQWYELPRRLCQSQWSVSVLLSPCNGQTETPAMDGTDPQVKLPLYCKVSPMHFSGDF